ncbi:peptidyl-prolyl cis-trans isomerase [bacterium]|nr:MAG: peptidyl-prolyl cis-trans isomerase [bacterium]
MNLKFFGATTSALLLATALAGCGGNTSTPGGGSPSDAVATVGSGSVTRAQLDQTLEGIYGEQMLPQLIDTQLLAEDLKSKSLEVTDAEVAAELTRLQEQDPTIKTAVEAGGARVEVIKNQVRRNLTVQKLLTVGITSDEAKEKAFFTTYSSYYATPTQNKLGLLAASTKVRADQLERALKTDPNSFAKLVEEQKGKAATDQIAGQSNADVGRFETPDEFATSRNIPTQLVAATIKALGTAKKGQVLPKQGLTPNGPFIIVKVIDRKEASKPDFAALKDQVATDYKMAQAALAEIKKNPQNPPKLEENIKQVAQLMQQPNPQTGAPGSRPALRDILTFILRPASNNMLDKLRTAGTVQISDTAYKEVAKQYQPLPGATGEAANTAAGNTAAANTAATNTATP